MEMNSGGRDRMIYENRADHSVILHLYEVYEKVLIQCDTYHFVSKKKHCDINENESHPEKTPY